ncbi:MAG: polysaccharide biosynthesis/export family protein [Pelagimonas sp.]|uniref:polysaccharide biosynthesis/export family protein n=1 Tax=Pelagimonas sp. TaxID=2073170 RepID=UPI003D6B8DD9
MKLLNKNKILRAFAFSTFFATSACGVLYQSPNVTEREDGSPVTVVPLSTETVARANSAPYTPRALPSVFYATAGNGSPGNGVGAIPASPYLPSANPQQQQFRPLPDVAPEAYRIGVGDILLLATRGTGTTVEQLSGLLAAQNQREGYTVRDDGSIAIPEVGPVQLSGLTIQQAEDRLFQVLVENQIDPSFSLEVAEFHSKRVAVGGAVKTAKLVPITLNTLTLSEAITAAGDISVRDKEFALIRIYRDGNLYQIPVSLYLDRQDLQKKVLLNGDAVFVDTSYDLDRAVEFFKAKIDVISLRTSARSTALQALDTEISLQRASLDERRHLFDLRQKLGAEKRDYVYLTGEVDSQSRFALPYQQHATLADVLYGEGGFDNTTGDPTQIYVLRADDKSDASGSITAYHLNARNAADLIIATRLQMRPNDVVFIEEQQITKWSRALQQLFPSLLRTVEGSLLP